MSRIASHFLFLSLISGSLMGQSVPGDLGYRFYHEVSNNEDTVISLTPTDSFLISTMRKKAWFVEDLELADSLRGVFSIEENPIQYATSLYVSGYAYKRFDESFTDSLWKASLSVFRDRDDIEGQIFTASALVRLNNHEGAKEISDFHYNLLMELVHDFPESDYPPAQMSQIRNWIELKSARSERISEEQLDSLFNYSQRYSIHSREVYPTLLSALGAQYVEIGKYEKASDMMRLAMKYAKEHTAEYNRYLINVGYVHLYMGNYDSAEYYMNIVRSSLEEDRENLTTAELYELSNTCVGLAKLSYTKGNFEEAFERLAYGFQANQDYTNAFQEAQDAYADKRFESSQARLRAEKLEYEAQIQKEARTRLILIVAFLSFFTVVLVVAVISRQRWVRRYREIARQKEKILNVISHDLTSSLSLMAKYSQIREHVKNTGTQDQVKELDVSFNESIVQMDLMISDLMNWGQSDRKKKEISIALADPVELIHQTLQVLHPLIKSKEIEVDFKDDDSAPLKTDVHALKLIIRNLILNAVKHSNAGSRVEITVSREDKQSVFRISNPIEERNLEPLQNLKKVFSSESSNTSITTTGLGFELIHSHLPLINGKLEINVEQEGVVRMELRVLVG